MNENILLACRDASLGYEGKAVWEHLDFQVRRGDYICIVGENGSGKSTLLKSLLGLIRPLSGHIDRAESLKAGAIGYLPQQTRAQKDFPATVTEVVRSGFLSAGGHRLLYTPAQKATALLNMGKLGILELKDKCYRELSGGQQQRVLLARALCAALLGVPLVLKRYSMIGDGLSHVSFGALSVAVACGWAPLPVSIPVVVIAALCLLRMTERSKLGADAAIAVVSASALAIGIIVTSLTTGMTTDVDSYMFGSILALSRADVALSVGLSVAVLVLFGLFYHQLFAITFDESFSRATGVKVGVYNTLLAVLTALTIVLGMRLMGAMLISSLVIFPALTAMRLRKSFFGVVVLAAIVSVVCFCAGLTASYLLSLPVGASVVAASLIAFLLAAAAGRLRRK